MDTAPEVPDPPDASGAPGPAEGPGGVERPGGFEALGLHPDLQRGVADAGFVELRPIQAAALPAALGGRDVLGLARTGTGKTAAFALPILHRLAADRAEAARPRALVLAPTRELARQIEGDLADLGRHLPLRVAAAYGGVKVDGQRAALEEGCEVLVACTGRLLDLVREGACHLDAVSVLVLDEADRLLDMGFLPDVRRILERVPDDRQTMLFSATMPEEVQALAQRVLRDPEIIDLGHTRPAETIEHTLHPVRASARSKLLRSIVEADEDGSAIVFARTKQRAKQVARQLEKRGHTVALLHGDKKQGARDRALAGFRAGEVRFLVATDLASRGLDVEGVARVVNYDVPLDPDTYVHRIGRTGRSERAGEAITIATVDELDLVRAIESRIGARIPRRFLPAFAPLDLHELLDEAADRRGPRRGGRRGGRGSRRRR
ncbi:MAG: DEAD/DEAH box helicase [Planctomycetota bacterium]|jgi:ATP-dependent RNA helicase RhlE